MVFTKNVSSESKFLIFPHCVHWLRLLIICTHILNEHLALWKGQKRHLKTMRRFTLLLTSIFAAIYFVYNLPYFVSTPSNEMWYGYVRKFFLWPEKKNLYIFSELGCTKNIEFEFHDFFCRCLLCSLCSFGCLSGVCQQYLPIENG